MRSEHLDYWIENIVSSLNKVKFENDINLQRYFYSVALIYLDYVKKDLFESEVN